MIKKIVLIACFFFSLMSNAQSGTASPYSFFGIGESRFKGNLENRSMSGLNIEQDSLHINILNPASFAAIRFTAFSIGGNYTSTSLKSDSKSDNTQRTAVDFIAVALPLGKVGVGFGLLPYTSVGYNIQSTDAAVDGVNNVLKGTGGLNKVFFSVGYKITSDFVVGADVQYNFGRINNSNLQFISGVLLGTEEKNKADLNGLATNFGAMYKRKIYKKMNLYTSLTYSPQATLSSTNTKTISTVTYNENYDVSIYEAMASKEIRNDLKIPQKTSFGFGVGETKKWLLGAQLVFQNVGKLADDYNTLDNVSYGKMASYSIGGFYVPRANVFSKYYQKIVYRGGLKFTNTGTIINSHEINEKSVSFGMGLPILGSISNANVGLEYGQRGTTSYGLIKENYVTLSVSFSLNDKWFGHRKID